jgi:hypothetical protein
MGDTCPKYAELYQSVMKSQKAKRITRRYQKLLNFVSKHAGINYNDILLLTYVYSNLYIEVFFLLLLFIRIALIVEKL